MKELPKTKLELIEHMLQLLEKMRIATAEAKGALDNAIKQTKRL